MSVPHRPGDVAPPPDSLVVRADLRISPHVSLFISKVGVAQWMM